MKNIQKFTIINLLIFILLAVAITSWYILSLNYLEEYDFTDIIRIFTQIGLVGAIIPSLTIALMNYFIIKIKSKLLIFFLALILIIFLIFQIYWITTNLFFYDINGPQSFLMSLLGAFES